MGRLGATKFWQRFDSDAAFRQAMHDAWTGQRVNRGQKKAAASKGAAAFWSRYHSDRAFKKAIDLKLRASRSRGGSTSLLTISEGAFKRRLAASAKSRSWPIYHDSKGNLLRSRLEVRVAQALQECGLAYAVENRVVVRGHAFYPDFTLAGGGKIIEVAGYAADWYWDKTAEKLKLIAKDRPTVHLAVVTPFLTMMKRRLENVPRITLFTPYQLEGLKDWCRGMPGFTSL